MADDAHGTPLVPLLPGDPRTVGPYRTVGRLGAGGMGVVLAAVDGAGAKAAVKLVHPAYAFDGEFRARFAREVAVLRKVRGTYVAQVIDADPDGERPWLATEYVPGPTLEAHVSRSGPLTGDGLHGLAAGLAEALTAIHAAEVVHRDLKPSNIILAPQGPRVVDFGIARALDETAMTRTGMVLGSPGWISPEEYRGEGAGPAADVYGWGLVVTFAATGTPPFGKGRPEVVAARVLGQAVDTEAVPEPLRTLVDRALAKDPGGRPTGDEVLATVLEFWRQDESEQEDITTLLTRTWTVPATGEPDWPTTMETPAPTITEHEAAPPTTMETPAPTVTDHEAAPPTTVEASSPTIIDRETVPPAIDRTRPPAPGRRRSTKIAATLAGLGLAAGAAVVVPQLLAEPPGERPAEAMASPVGTGLSGAPITAAASPTASPSPSPSSTSPRPTSFAGITFTLPADWRLVEVSKSVACLESPDDRGVSGPWGFPCRPDSLVLELRPDPLAWPVASIDGPEQGWAQGNATLPCLAGGNVKSDPKYASSDLNVEDLSPRHVHDVMAFDDYATAAGGEVVASGLTPLADGRKAAHRRWKVPCNEEDWTFVQEAWWLPVSRVAFYALSVKEGRSKTYDTIVRSANLTTYKKAAKPAFADVEKLGMLTLSDDDSSLTFQPAKRQWVDHNGEHVPKSRASNWYAVETGTPVTAKVSPGFAFYALRDGAPDDYEMRTLSDLKDFLRARAGTRRGYPAFTVSFDENGLIYAVAQVFQA